MADSNGTSQPEPGEIKNQLEQTSAVILQGPPGTGKTRLCRKIIEEFAHSGDQCDDEDDWGSLRERQWSQLTAAATGGKQVRNAADLAEAVDLPDSNYDDTDVVWELVQLHPGYTYEDFVRGIETDTDSDAAVSFVAQDRIVVQLAEFAKNNRDVNVVLVLDEINRASLADVLGELILTLERDKRTKQTDGDSNSRDDGWHVQLQYPTPEYENPDNTVTEGASGGFAMPDNLYILGTMNTADQAIAKIDYAIRRRFRFFNIPPSPNEVWSYYTGTDPDNRAAAGPDLSNDEEFALLTEGILRAINRQIDDRRLKLGHSYVLVDPPDEPDRVVLLADKLAYDALPLLREYARNGELDAGNSIDLEFKITGVNGNQDDKINFDYDDKPDDGENGLSVDGGLPIETEGNNNRQREIKQKIIDEFPDD
jgi:5-methylcytosine-specific restriction protein B